MIQVVDNYLRSGIRFVYLQLCPRNDRNRVPGDRATVGADGTMTDVGMWIDHRHEHARGGETMRVENPATEEMIASVPRAQAADVAAAVEHARVAQREWRRCLGSTRRSSCTRWPRACAPCIESWPRR